MQGIYANSESHAPKGAGVPHRKMRQDTVRARSGKPLNATLSGELVRKQQEVPGDLEARDEVEQEWGKQVTILLSEWEERKCYITTTVCGCLQGQKDQSVAPECSHTVTKSACPSLHQLGPLHSQPSALFTNLQIQGGSPFTNWSAGRAGAL